MDVDVRVKRYLPKIRRHKSDSEIVPFLLFKVVKVRFVAFRSNKFCTETCAMRL